MKVDSPCKSLFYLSLLSLVCKLANTPLALLFLDLAVSATLHLLLTSVVALYLPGAVRAFGLPSCGETESTKVLTFR